MAIGFGGGSDMMKSVNSNRAQTRVGRKDRKSLQDTLGNSDAKKKSTEGIFKELDPEEFQKFKLQLQEEKKKHDLKLKILFVAILAAALLIAFML
jgi:hypothetical protein